MLVQTMNSLAELITKPWESDSDQEWEPWEESEDEFLEIVS